MPPNPLVRAISAAMQQCESRVVRGGRTNHLMCGICGIVHRDIGQTVERDALAAMNAQLLHRGPDDEGLHISGHVGLAVRRLSIIDIPTGHQPIANEDETLWIVYNGEIYNHRELRETLEARGHRYRTNSDTETILHLYEEHGPSCVEKLRGMFAFAIWDGGRQSLFLARDRVGIKPLYYHFEGGTFLFASEIKAILKYPGVKAAFNEGALSEYLAFGYLSGSQTMFCGIQKLLPGHTLELNAQGGVKVEPYWDLSTQEDTDPRPRDYYVRTYRELLEDSVSAHLLSDVPLGIFLSGGVDSSAIAALATKLRGELLETFSVGYDDPGFSELPQARQVAAHLRANHHEIRVRQQQFFEALPQLIWHEDEPIAWPSSVALYFVAKLAGGRVKVVLTGEGSDETLAGYTRYTWTLKNLRMHGVYREVMPSFIRRGIRKGIKASPLPAAIFRKLDHTFLLRDGDSWCSFYFDNFYSAFSAEEQNELLSIKAKSTIQDGYSNTMQYWNRYSGELLHRMLYTDIKTYLVELLMKQDQMSMAASVESRVPFLDHKLVESAARIPANYLFDGLRGKSILKSAISDLLPKSIVHRRKMGFPTPWSHWLAGARLDEIEATLLSPRALNRGLFEKAAVEKLFRQHRTGRRDHSTRIWRLLNLELWQRIFVDGEWPSGVQGRN